MTHEGGDQEMTHEFRCDVEITVRGRPGAGKSHVAMIIARALEQHGVQVTVDAPNEGVGWLAHISQRIKEGLRAMPNSKATVRELQASKGAKLHKLSKGPISHVF